MRPRNSITIHSKTTEFYQEKYVFRLFQVINFLDVTVDLIIRNSQVEAHKSLYISNTLRGKSLSDHQFIIMNNGITDAVFTCGSSCAEDSTRWDVTQIIMNQPISAVKYAVLILNRPVSQSQGFLNRIWNNASLRVTVDGGTKQWDKYLSNLSEEVRKSMKLPDLITGDFDSITQEILDKYKKKGCKAIHTPDQNYTDFTKALIELNVHCQESGLQIDHVLTFAQSSGRLDQIVGNIQTLFLVRDKLLLNPNTRVYMMSDDSLSWLLSPGYHVITIPEDSRKHKRAWCSLVPIGEPCQFVTSTGLKWNLDNIPLKFGHLVSTSNTFDGSEQVTIKCSHSLLWSMRIPSLLDPIKL